MTGNAPTHTCSYFCDKPECIKAQRDELREKLAALKSQPVPVEPDVVKRIRIAGQSDTLLSVIEYIDALKAYALRMAAEAREQRERAELAEKTLKKWKDDGEHLFCQTCNSCGIDDCCPPSQCWSTRAESLSAENAKLKAKNDALRKLLSEAAEDIESWGAYASEYFQNKHDLAGDVKQYRDVSLAKGGGE